MKVEKITLEWEDGKRVYIEGDAVTQLLEAGGNEDIQMYLILAFARNLSGGYHWRHLEDTNDKH